MYKLVIVEDERDVRQRIISLIGKTNSNFTIVGEYENGIDAYDGIQNDSPDLIVTDIKIPYINGLELAAQVRQMLPLVKVLVITGYNEFDYAKQAANLGVLGFISKPVTGEEIGAQLAKAEQILDEEYLSTASLKQLEAFYNSNLPIIRENDLNRLSTLSEVRPAFEKRLQHNEIDLDYECFAMAILDFDESGEEHPEQYEYALASAREMVQESAQGFCEVDIFRREESLCIILKAHEPLDMGRAEGMLEQVLGRLGRHSGMPASAGLSRAWQGERNFAAMRREASRALEHRGVMGGGKVFYYGNILPAAGAGLAVDDSEIKELGYLLRFRSAAACNGAMGHIRERLEDSGAHYSYHYTLTAILNTLVKACDDLEGLYAAHEGPEGIYRRLFGMKTPDEAFAFFAKLAGDIRALNDGMIVDSAEQNLQRVLDYIGAHYRDADINFEGVATAVNLSVSYISALFKKHLNTSFVKYLTGLRMEQAKALLANPAFKIMDISEQLGYSDPYYFSHCFKKYTGMSPKEFRAGE